MKLRTTTVLLALGLAACSSKATKPDDKTPTEDPGFLLRGEVPPLSELELVEAPAAEPTGELGQVKAFRIGDLRVLHKKTTANTVVQARVYIKGGLANLTDSTAGIELLALRVATNGGTQETPKDEFNSKLDATGASVFSFTDRDYSGYGLKTLTDHFDQNWDLFTQAVLSPAMPTDEIEVRRQKQLAAIASMLDSPDSHLRYAIGQHMFSGHPYSYLDIGSKENVEGFTRDQLLSYQRAMLVPANMLVVVVGNLESADVLERVRSSFGRLKGKKAAPIVPGDFTSEPGTVFAEKELPTNYILGMFPGPSPASDDYPAMLIATDYLRERLFEEVRTKRNLTYAVSSGLADQVSNYGYLYVTAVEPEKTMPVMFAEIAKLREAPVDATALEQTKNVFITEHYMGLQTNGSQASALAQAELVAGDWRKAEQELEKIEAVSPEDVHRVAKTYFKDYRFAVVGPKTSLPQELFGVGTPAE